MDPETPTPDQAPPEPVAPSPPPPGSPDLLTPPVDPASGLNPLLDGTIPPASSGHPNWLILLSVVAILGAISIVDLYWGGPGNPLNQPNTWHIGVFLHAMAYLLLALIIGAIMWFVFGMARSGRDDTNDTAHQQLGAWKRIGYVFAGLFALAFVVFFAINSGRSVIGLFSQPKTYASSCRVSYNAAAKSGIHYYMEIPNKSEDMEISHSDYDVLSGGADGGDSGHGLACSEQVQITYIDEADLIIKLNIGNY